VSAQVEPYTAMAPYGLAVDPNGGNNFLGLVLTPSGVTRAQHDFNFSASEQWSISYDLDAVNMTLTGGDTTYGSYYIGGFSVFTINAGTASFIVDEAWDSSATDSTYSVLYFVYDASGDALNGGNGTTAWSGLLQNNWYTQSTLFDTKTNQILLVSLINLTTGVTSSFSPSGWYMLGGLDRQFLPQGVPNVDPNAFRVAGMGATNGFLVDNFDLDAVPEPATLLLTGLGLIGLIAFRRR